MSKTTKRKKIEIKQNKERGGLITTDGEREIWKGCQLLEISPPRYVGSREWVLRAEPSEEGRWEGR